MKRAHTHHTHKITHKRNLESLTSPNEIPRKRKRKLKFLEVRPIRSSPSARVATALGDANRVQGLLEAHSASCFYHFPAHVRRNKRNPGNLFRRSCRFFPHPPRPLFPWSHDTRPHAQLFPAINIIIYRSSRGSWSIRVTVLYIYI